MTCGATTTRTCAGKGTIGAECLWQVSLPPCESMLQLLLCLCCFLPVEATRNSWKICGSHNVHWILLCLTVIIDCEVSSWSAWSPCPVTCGADGATHSRSRTIVKAPSPSGKQCPPLEETVPCGFQPCCMCLVPQPFALGNIWDLDRLQAQLQAVQPQPQSTFPPDYANQNNCCFEFKFTFHRWLGMKRLRLGLNLAKFNFNLNN